MRTKQIYLDDSYLKEMDASILEVASEGEGRYRLILDKTVFYPMGGGQATDQGTLKNETGQYEVYQVMNKDGEIWHYVKSPTALQIGDVVHGAINWERRYKNMKLHSAGHIIDFAMFVLGYSPITLVPIKADHDKNPHIVYQGVSHEEIQKNLEEKVKGLVKDKLVFSWYFQPLEELQKDAIYLQPGLPTNKPLRTLRLEGIGAVADGGTQVKNTSEVENIHIIGVEEKEGNTIIKYSLT